MSKRRIRKRVGRPHRWQLPDRIGGVYASPVLADGRLYYFDRYGSAVVLTAKPEFEQLAVNRIEGDRTRFDGSPAVDGKRLLMRSGKFLYCLGE